MTGPAEFKKNGFCVHKPLFDASDLSEIQRVLRASAPHEPCLWPKDIAASDANVLNVATHPAIVRHLQPLLGHDIVLWGASFLERTPGQVHLWHTDLESSRPEGGFVSVWIGLEGTNQASSLKLVLGSHTLGKALQEVTAERGVARDSVGDDDVSAWARACGVETGEVVQPDVTVGDAIFFDGRLWHGSANSNPDTTRHALLLQYAAAHAPARIPDFSGEEAWPFRFLEVPRPACITVAGEPDPRVNSLVELPPVLDASLARLGSSVHTINAELPVSPGEHMRSEHFLDGWSGNLQRMRSHYSVLAPGKTPHAPHSHIDEELLIVVQGEGTLRYDDGDGTIRDHRVAPGDGVYYPAFQRHTIHNHGDLPLVYVMLKWMAARSGAKQPLGVQRFCVPPLDAADLPERGYSNRECFTGATHHLQKLHAHVSTLLPDGGYDAHEDEHDIALLILEGRVETLGRTAGAGELVWCASGETHGMHNPGPDPARYIVFEFHGAGCSGDYTAYRKPDTPRTLLKQRSTARIVKNFRRMLGLRR